MASPLEFNHTVDTCARIIINLLLINLLTAEFLHIAQLYPSANTTLSNRKNSRPILRSYDVFLNFILGPVTFFSINN